MSQFGHICAGFGLVKYLYRKNHPKDTRNKENGYLSGDFFDIDTFIGAN